jgi:aspartyl/glutamyl-tRNA(Asn/Gln) amidotransferase C subunit
MFATRIVSRRNRQIMYYTRYYTKKIFESEAAFKPVWSLQDFMMKNVSDQHVTEEQLNKLSTLSRIEIPKDEKFIKNLKMIISWQNIIKNIELTNEPMYTPFNQKNTEVEYREDVVEENLGKQIDYAPSKKGKFYRVPKIIEQ